MRHRQRGEISIFSISFFDVLTNTIGGLSFLFIFPILMIGDVRQVSMTVLADSNPPLVIKTKKLPIAFVGEEYFVPLLVQGGKPPYFFPKEERTISEGLKIQDGIIQGIPREFGIFSVHIFISDSLGQEAATTIEIEIRKQDFSLIIPIVIGTTFGGLVLICLWKRKMPVLLPLQIITKAVPNGRAGFDYTVQLACIGGIPPYRWYCDVLPPDLKISREGRIYGTFQKEGKYSLTLKLIDSQNFSCSQNFLMKVDPNEAMKDCQCALCYQGRIDLYDGRTTVSATTADISMDAGPFRKFVRNLDPHRYYILCLVPSDTSTDRELFLKAKDVADNENGIWMQALIEDSKSQWERWNSYKSKMIKVCYK